MVTGARRLGAERFLQTKTHIDRRWMDFGPAIESGAGTVARRFCLNGHSGSDKAARASQAAPPFFRIQNSAEQNGIPHCPKTRVCRGFSRIRLYRPRILPQPRQKPWPNRTQDPIIGQ
jgi:hypothetical protein